MLPHYKMTNKDIFYPERAKADGVERKVLVAFDIAANEPVAATRPGTARDGS